MMNYLTAITISLWAFAIGLYIGLYGRLKLRAMQEKNASTIVEEEKEPDLQGKTNLTVQELKLFESMANLLNYDGNPQKEKE